ncbi:MAG TPA: hypothetical protein VNN73_00965 [Blastocatellia bacterium]|jgi:hypothetical protein|nr:hypothetical protein [Blastocatellia bacterium]
MNKHLALALILFVLSSLLVGCNMLSGETKINEGIVTQEKATIRSSTAPASLPLAEVKRGDHLDILEQTQVKTPTQIEEWYKVRMKAGQAVEGWIQARYVASKSIVDKVQELYEKSKVIPSQGTGRLKVQTKLRVEPGGDVLTFLPRGTMVEIVSKTRTTIKPEKQEDTDDTDEVSEEPEARTVLWYQVRLPDSEVLRAGWVGAQQVQLDVPDDILYLEGEGRVFTGWVVFDQTRDKDGSAHDDYIAVMKSLGSDTPFDFTRLWVLVYVPGKEPGKGYYTNKGLENGLRGMLPITLTTSSGRRGFTFHELDENGKPVPVEYEITGTIPNIRVQRISPKIVIKPAPKTRPKR